MDLVPIKTTELMKKMGEVPVFYEGVVTDIHLYGANATLTLLLKAEHNPRFKKDTLVEIICLDIHHFKFEKKSYDRQLLKIHDFDIKRLDNTLLLRIEDHEGLFQEIEFETINMHEKTG
jgi:hypothetical protein